MSSVIQVEIPETISKIIKPEHVTRSEFKSEIEFEVNQIYNQFDEMIESINTQNERIKDLESKQSQIKVSPGHQRQEMLFDVVKTTRSINTKRVRQMFELKQNHQAIRIMKSTAKRYPEIVYIHQSESRHKEVTLNMKEDND